MKRLTSLLAVLLLSFPPSLCFSAQAFTGPMIPDHFGLLRALITQEVSRVTETVMRDLLFQGQNENTEYTKSKAVLAPPANDNFANRGHIGGPSGFALVDDTEATFEPGEPFHFSFGFGRNTIWYTWTTPNNGTFGFDTYSSAVTTLVALYRGSSLTNLTRVSTGYPLYTSITAPAGTVYQIAVMGSTSASKGVTHLRYYPDSISGNTNLAITTNVFLNLIPAPDGSIAYTVAKVVLEISSPTNRYGYPVNPGLAFNMYPRGLNIYDHKNTAVIINAYPDGAGAQYLLLDYDGKQVLLYNQVTQKLLLYRLTRRGLMKTGEAVVPHTSGAKIQGSYIYALQVSADSYLNGQTTMGIQAFDKRLKRMKWQLLYEKGIVELHFKTGYAFRFVADPYTQKIVGYKKGSEQNRFNMDYSFTGDTQIQTDPVGNILAWYESGSYPFTSNSPLTYISRKGETVFSNRTLPDAGNAWAFSGFEKSRLYIVRPNGSTQIAAGYKMGKTIVQSGNRPLADFGYAESVDGQFIVYRSNGLDTEGFTQYDKNVKKETWNEPISQGSVEYIGKGTFLRARMIPGAGSTNYLIKIFTRKKTVADHQIVM